MDWVISNWVWIIIGISFVAMHLFGHKGHARHRGHVGSGSQGSESERANVDRDAKPGNTPACH